jgi:ankyrin repeat protein
MLQSTDIVAALVSMKDDQLEKSLKQRDHYGWTVLARACGQGNLEIAKVLLDLGAYPTLMCYTATGGLMHGIQALRTDSTGVELVRLLVQHGAKLDILDEEGFTALMRAAARGTIEACQNLIDVGAGLETESKFGGNAVSYAARNGKIEAVRLLLKNGASAKPPSLLKGKWKDLSFDPQVAPELKREVLTLLNASTRTWRGVTSKLFSPQADQSTVDDLFSLVQESPSLQQVSKLFKSS